MFKKKKKNNEKEVLSLKEIERQNKDLYKQLTNKNQNYMFQLNNRLESLNYDTKKKAYVFNEMYQEMLAAQSSSITARKMYGTVTEQAEHILNKNVITDEEANQSFDWKLYVDSALLAGGLFNLISGFGAMQAQATADNQVRLIQLILNFIIGGFVIMLLTKFAPTKGQTKGFIEYILVTVGVILGWSFMMTFVLMFIPDAINPIVPGVIAMILGAAALIGKWQFKKRFNVQGTLF